MPSWKKVIVSGSDAVLNSLNVATNVTASSFTGSFVGLLSGTASFAQTASSADNFTVRGTLTAQTINVQTITSSIEFNTGSTRNGSLLTNTHQFTGSVGITGSLAVTAGVVNQLTSSFAVTASYWSGSIGLATTASYVLNAVSSSYASSSQNALTASHALNGGVTQLVAGPNITLSPTTGVGQVTISSAGSGGPFFNTATGSYGSFYDTTTQTNVANTPRSMSLNTTDITNGVSVSGSTSPFNTYIKVQNPGVYNIQFSAQVDKTDSGTDEIWVWIRKNGTNVNDSATSIQLVGNGAHYVAAWNFFVNAAANDYFQLMWYSPDANVRLHAEPAFGVVPGIPSLIVTVNRIDQFLSNTGSFSGSFNGSLFGTASYAITASNAQTASYIITAQTASYVLTAQTASYVLNAVSSSYASSSQNALTASFVNPLRQNVQITGSLFISSSTAALNLFGSGSSVFSVDGTSGRLFSVDDSMSGSLFSVNTAAGLPIIEAFSDNTIRMGQFGQRGLFVSGSRVGIGKEIPLNASLDISGSTVVSGSLLVTGSTTTIGSDTVTGSFSVTGSLNANNSLYVSASRVGVGIASPSQSLDVLGTIRITNPGGGSILEFYNNSTTFNGPAVTAKIVGGQQVNNGSGYLGFFTTTNSIQTEWIRLDRNGNFSIGKTTANTPLDILGNTTITGSLTVTGSSVFSGSVTSTIGFTGSLSGSVTHAFTSSYADNFTVGNTLTAQRIVVQTISSSISYLTGSTRHGSLLTDTHQFTGSVGITGSLQVNGTTAILGTGTINTIPKFTAANVIGNSAISDDGTLITLGRNTFLGSNSLAIGTSTGYSSTGISVSNNKLLTGNTVAAMIAGYATIQSDVTSTAYGVFIGNYMQAAAFTLSNYYYYYATQQSTGGGSTITNQYGYYVADLSAGTNNYSFYGSTAAGTNRWNLFMNGTAKNYLNGSLLIGSTTDAGFKLDVTGSTRLNGAVTVASASIQSQNTSSLALGTQTISTNATSSFTAAFYNYTIASGSNTRAGQFIATWNGGSIQYMDNSTVDIGNTLPVALTASLSGANVLLTSTLPSTGWTIKTLVNLI